MFPVPRNVSEVHIAVMAKMLKLLILEYLHEGGTLFVQVNSVHRIVTISMAAGILLINKHSPLNPRRMPPAPLTHCEEQLSTTTEGLYGNTLN